MLQFGSLAEAVRVPLDGKDTAAYDIQELRWGMNEFHQQLQDFSAAAQIDSKGILKVIAKMRDMANSRNTEVKNRVARLEASLDRPRLRTHSPPRPPKIPNHRANL